MIVFKLLIPVALITTGCSAATVKEKIIRDMAIGGLVGAVVGQQKQSNRTAYTLLYGGLGSTAAGVASLYYHDPDKLEDTKKENERLKGKLDEFQKRFEPKIISEGNNLFAKQMPKEVSHLIQPGEWKRYKMDEWVQDPNQPNTWFRQIEMLEIIPPAAR